MPQRILDKLSVWNVIFMKLNTINRRALFVYWFIKKYLYYMCKCSIILIWQNIHDE